MAVNQNNKLTAVVPVLRPSLHQKTLMEILSSSKNVSTVIFVIDNTCSLTTEDLEIIDFLTESESPKTLVLHGFFGNAGLARNYGLKFVESEWVTFWDSDDRVWPDIYLNLIEENTFADVIVGQFETIRGTTSRLSSTSSLIELAINPGLWRMIWRRSLLSNLWFPSLKMGEDQIFLMQLNLHNLQIVFSKEIIYQYNSLVQGQLTNSPSALRELEQSIIVARDCLKKLPVHQYRFIIFTRLSITFLKQKNISWLRKIKPLIALFGVRQLTAVLQILFFRKKNHD